MGYLIGAGPLDPAVKRYDGGTSSFTMDNSGTTNGTLLWVDGVAQVPGTDYNVSGTTITTTTAAGAGTNNVTSLQLFNTGLITTPADNTVAIAKIQDDAVTLAKMAAGTDGNIISYDTSGNPVAVATGDDGQVLTSSGAGAVCAFETLATGARTYGTEIDANSTSEEFTGLPAGLTQVIIYWEAVSWSGTVTGTTVLGDSGGYETSGYLHNSIQTSGSSANNALTSLTSSFGIRTANGAGESFSLMSIFDLMEASTNTWMWRHHGYGENTTTHGLIGAGKKSLSGTLTQIKMSGGTFDAGRFQISYS